METISIELLWIRPDYSARSLMVNYYDVGNNKDAFACISFLDLALVISPKGRGKIDAGYEFEAYDETQGGGYIDFHELTMEPVDFFSEILGDGEYRLRKDLKKMYYSLILEACRSIISGRN